MSANLDELDRLVVTIVSVRRRLGVKAYRAALSAARQAVAALVLREAESRAGADGQTSPKGEIVELSRAIRQRKPSREVEGE